MLGAETVEEVVIASSALTLTELLKKNPNRTNDVPISSDRRKYFIKLPLFSMVASLKHCYCTKEHAKRFQRDVNTFNRQLFDLTLLTSSRRFSSLIREIIWYIGDGEISLINGGE